MVVRQARRAGRLNTSLQVGRRTSVVHHLRRTGRVDAVVFK